MRTSGGRDVVAILEIKETQVTPGISCVVSDRRSGDLCAGWRNVGQHSGIATEHHALRTLFRATETPDLSRLGQYRGWPTQRAKSIASSPVTSRGTEA